MEIKKKKTLSGLFVRYICLFCVNTLLLFLLIVPVFNGFIDAGIILRANSSETELNEKRDEIVNAEHVEQEMVPQGCTYGVYEASGEYRYGIFSGEDAAAAWGSFQENNVFAEGGGYYRFLVRESGEICIVKYDIVSRFSKEILNKYLPSPVVCALILFVVFFLLQAVWVSRHFGRKLSRELRVLNDITESIRCQNLEFEEQHSDIREVEEVLYSLSRMRGALKESLDRQWRMEKARREQAAALAHDIKTPLTIIRGNAELLGEEELGGAAKEYQEYILRNAEEIEEYLIILQDMMLSEERPAEPVSVTCRDMAENLADRARRLAESFRIAAEVVPGELSESEILCDLGQIQRAWDNIVSNALEHTPREKKIRIVIKCIESSGKNYLAAKVLDGGAGFTEEELIHGAEQFYQGDKSRHEKKHRGLGLYTASEFAGRQGGLVILGNAEGEEFGGEVTLMLKIGTG